MAFRLSSRRKTIYKSLAWAFHSFDLDCGVLVSHTCFKALTTSKGVFIFSLHYASYKNFKMANGLKLEKRWMEWKEGLHRSFGPQCNIHIVSSVVTYFPLKRFTLISIPNVLWLTRPLRARIYNFICFKNERFQTYLHSECNLWFLQSSGKIKVKHASLESRI